MEKINTEEILRRRFWLIKNLDWLMDEVVFHKDNSDYFKNPKLLVWKLGHEKGRVTI